MRSCALLAADLYIFLVEKIRLDRQTSFFSNRELQIVCLSDFFLNQRASDLAVAIHLTEDLKGINLN